ncbi:hypothetical protein WR25_22231 [Diploscapter pachys]|uniref:Calponin-homology (CH) domain-containing protein n=1 Tax=Diploscapter pachys TaxID=2018661 RepID=A0A2A2L5K8_9BILA|nr:hypothetical protein WR25_22231 [Diploscapter pachys]
MASGQAMSASYCGFERGHRRNRSLLLTHSEYMGYSAYLGSIHRVPTGQTTFLPYGQDEPISPLRCVDVFSSLYCGDPPEIFHTATFVFADSPPLCSPEDDADLISEESEAQPVKKSSQQYSTSSGYGSTGSGTESDQDQDSSQSDCRQYHSARTEKKARPVNVRRHSAPSRRVNSCRQVPETREPTNPETINSQNMEVRGVNPYESVVAMARRFGEMGAAKDNQYYKSRKGLALGEKENDKIIARSESVVVSNTCKSEVLGGIASLRKERPSSTMSRTNMFKQMEKVGSTPGAAGVPRQLNPNSIKDALLRWVQNRINDYPNVNVTNFSSSWADGMAFCALIHRFAPHSFDFSKLDPANRRQNFDLAFKVAEDNGIFPLLEVDDMIMMGDRPDWKCVFTYVQSFYKQFRDRP